MEEDGALLLSPDWEDPLPSWAAFFFSFSLLSRSRTVVRETDPEERTSTSSGFEVTLSLFCTGRMLYILC